MNARPLVLVDALAIARLWHTGARESGAIDPTFLPGVSIHQYASQLEADLSMGKLIGWGIFAPDTEDLCAYLTAQINERGPEFQQEQYLYIEDIDVDRSYRQMGYAKRLIGLAIEYARNIGIRRVEVSWLASDSRSNEVWSKLGFRPYMHRGYLLDSGST